ncbi:MAG: GTP-binding protein [Richelia sp. RM2_1_2]|nr:GTP-binding protein [Richelia sp. SM1_7_0]NJN09320.1 GTP-binding protein [Richelia sp. RM1_1_1]NJO28417.1 GTP-binding protein [Richelia sp. SL_2_1]NJO59025.1 GTP-binding protein [Richelia sp. RM2_1_2]
MVNKISPLPAFLILGFAGSGKTSLIKHLSNQTGTTVEHIQSGSSELGSGCICCSGLKDLKQLIKDLLIDRESEKTEFQQLFIEASHETDPIPVIRTIRQHFPSAKIFLKEVITVINAANYPPKNAESYLVTNQIFFADKIVVNYCDTATDEQINKCHKHIRGVKWQPIFNAIQGIVNTNDFRVPSTVEASTGVSTVISFSS